METFGTNNCPCGNMNTRCIVGDESSHSHDGDSDDSSSDDMARRDRLLQSDSSSADQTFTECFNGAERNSLPGTELCGDCKTACHCNDSEDTPSGPCKGECSDKFGVTNCMCGNNRCIEGDESSHSHDGSASDDQTFEECMAGVERNSLPGTEECGDCKVACHCNDSEDTPSGPCKGACGDTFGVTNCMCGNNRCIEGDESSHSHDGSASDEQTFEECMAGVERNSLPGTEECGDCKVACQCN